MVVAKGWCVCITAVAPSTGKRALWMGLWMLDADMFASPSPSITSPVKKSTPMRQDAVTWIKRWLHSVLCIFFPKKVIFLPKSFDLKFSPEPSFYSLEFVFMFLFLILARFLYRKTKESRKLSTWFHSAGYEYFDQGPRFDWIDILSTIKYLRNQKINRVLHICTIPGSIRRTTSSDSCLDWVRDFLIEGQYSTTIFHDRDNFSGHKV